MTPDKRTTVALGHGTEQAPRAIVRKSLLAALLATVVCTASVFAIVRDGRWVKLHYPDVRIEDDCQSFPSQATSGQTQPRTQLAFHP